MRRHPFLPATTGLIAAIVFFGGCRDEKIASYRIEKDKDNPASAPDPSSTPPVAVPSGSPPAGGPAMATAVGAGLTWTAAPGWQVKPAGAMRKGSYSIKNFAGDVGEVAITAFPGDVGGEAANVNRWRSQLQLAPVAASEVAAALVRMDCNGLKIALVDLMNPTAPAATRMLGAIVPFDGSTWFFKLTGPASLIASEKPAFTEFLATIRPAGSATP